MLPSGLLAISLAALIWSAPKEIAERASSLRLPSSVRELRVAVVSFVGLDFQPAMVVSLHGFAPLDVGLGVVLSNTSFDKGAW